MRDEGYGCNHIPHLSSLISHPSSSASQLAFFRHPPSGGADDPLDQVDVWHPGEVADDRQVRALGMQARQRIGLNETWPAMVVAADIDPAARADEIFAFMVGKPLFAEMNRRFGGHAFRAVGLR